MNSLYDRFKPQFDDLKSQGFHSIAEMAKHFDNHYAMSSALGYSDAARHWIAGKNASTQSNNRARRWLDSVGDIQAHLWPNGRATTAPDANPNAQNDAANPVKLCSVFVVTCPSGTDDKARKLLALIGCDITEV